jgi:hypothetical protein
MNARNAPRSSSSRAGGAALARALATAWADMRRLQSYARQFGADGESAFSPDQIEALCSFLERASANLQGRIVSLDGEARLLLSDRLRRGSRRERHLRLGSLIGAYRSCCRHLCQALGAAKRLGDAVTAWLLTDVVHRLERQLWLLDPRSGACRAAALFYRS